MAVIQFFYADTSISLSGRTRLKQFLISQAKKEKQQISQLSFIFCTDKYLLEINRRFLNHHFYTDIITFDLRNPGEKQMVGEIYISADRVRENAQTFGCTLKQELHRVIFHGLLHLCGYGDKTPGQQKIMRKKEEEYLIRYFGT
jgi:probable rRNA maturation factor